MNEWMDEINSAEISEFWRGEEAQSESVPLEEPLSRECCVNPQRRRWRNVGQPLLLNNFAVQISTQIAFIVAELGIVLVQYKTEV